MVKDENVKIDMVGKNIELTAAIKQYIEEKSGVFTAILIPFSA